MPITQWFCPSCCHPVGFDHFELTACGGVHPDYARAVLRDVQTTAAERRGRVGVSNAMGCPRSRAIQEVEEVAINPLEYNAVLTGTGWHSMMAGDHPDSEVEVRGTINGIELTGHIDRVRRDESGILLIEDWKHTNDYARKTITDLKEPKPEHVVQASIYAELYNQTFDEMPKGIVVWYHFTAGKPPMIPKRASVKPIEECLNVYPFECDWSIGELYQQLQVPVEDWRDLPMVGESQKFGTKTMCDYCWVRMTCWEADKHAPF